MMFARLAPLAVLAGGLLLAAPAMAEKVANRVAVFTGLDKITGRIITFDVYIDETVLFGQLKVTPRVCYNRPATESAQTDAFVEVEEITLDQTVQKIFTGWMFAASPGLNAVEHPVFDVWLTDCRQESQIPPPEARGDGQTREATANLPPGEEDADGDRYGVEFVDGIPIPREKPSMDQVAPSVELPPEDALPEGGEILD